VEVQDFFTGRGCLEKRLASVFAVFVPILAAELFKYVNVPPERVATPRLGLYVVPEHVFLALAARPSSFAGKGAGLAGNALVEIENDGPWPLRAMPLIGVSHIALELPGLHSCHGSLPPCNLDEGSGRIDLHRLAFVRR